VHGVRSAQRTPDWAARFIVSFFWRRRRLGEAVQLHTAQDAIVLQAGPVPAPGDVNRGEMLPSYRAVYA
jgi:hypothetical protein